MLRAPGQGLATQTRTWGDCKAAYRLLNCEAVTHEHLLQPHCQQTRRDAAELPVVLFVQDTIELDFSAMLSAQGYGPIGDHRGQGLWVHSLLGLGVDDDVLGLAAQRCWARDKDKTYKHSETRAQRCSRKGKESDVWHQVLSDVGPVPAGKRWVSIGDRGSDSFTYWAKARDMGWQCLSRIFIDRRTVEQHHVLSLAPGCCWPHGPLIVGRKRANVCSGTRGVGVSRSFTNASKRVAVSKRVNSRTHRPHRHCWAFAVWWRRSYWH